TDTLFSLPCANILIPCYAILYRISNISHIHLFALEILMIYSGIFNYLAKKVAPEKVIYLNYPVTQKQRWDKVHPNKAIYEILNQHRDNYAYHLNSFLAFREKFIDIPGLQPVSHDSQEPYWNNTWISALDAIALYSFIAINKPKYYIEVGSGNSTKFARKAVDDYRLNTKIISIDPCPRTEIDTICDEIIRHPAETVNLEIFDKLNVNDILFIDSSHRSFMNSDVTMLFLDVIPRLKPGVVVEIHDIFLPYDYPSNWTSCYFSEQYLMGTFLLAEGNKFEILLSDSFVSNDKSLSGILTPLWQESTFTNADKSGSSFWIRTN
ncbi:MAG: class I SAM-dependent methyltransferase, partial [Candidatus Nanoarchaeia archaeon]